MVLSLKGLAAGYGARTVIFVVSFTLEPGQILAFLGHNGAGKTEIRKTIMGMLRPTAGEVLFDRNRIDRLSVAENIDGVAVRDATTDRVTWMNNGEIVFDGSPGEARGSNFWRYF